MLVKNISIKNFRNHTNRKDENFNQINVLHGQNGVGKTSLIEAIYFAINGKSFKESNVENIIKFDNEQSMISLLLNDDGKDNEIRSVITKSTVDVFYNKSKSTRKDIRNKFNTALFEPQGLSNMISEKRTRLRFIDQKLSLTKPIYSFLLRKATKLEDEKKTFLKTGKVNKSLMTIINKQLANVYVEIINFRINFIKEINNEFGTHLKYFNIEFNDVEVNYKNKYRFKPEEFIVQELNNDLDDETKSRKLNFSIFKDDISILINNRDINVFYSQGQKRICYINLIITLSDIIKKNTGFKPIVFLDDVFSELDKHNKNALLEFVLQSDQAFITTNSIDDLEQIKGSKFIEIKAA